MLGMLMARHRQVDGRESAESLGDIRGDCLLFCEGLMDSGGCKFSLGMKGQGSAIAFVPVHQHSRTSERNTVPPMEAGVAYTTSTPLSLVGTYLLGQV